jgi:3-deoxy-D-manno-octulosonic-acid transferase
LFLYRLLATSALLAYSPFAILRSLAGRRELGDIRGRLGRSAYPDLEGGVWVHAVSVGEVGVANTLLRSLARAAPGRRLGLSVTTRAGRELADRTAGGVPVFAFPFDISRAVDRALDSVRPGLVLLTETELWPLFLQRARARGIPVALVNGRLSERSFRRYRLIRRWFFGVLGNVSRFAMQSERDAERIADLGAPAANIRVTGNLKYDVAAPPPFPDADRLRAAARGRPVLVAGSTREGEEPLVLAAWKRLTVPTLLALAPRRPERFPAVAGELERRGERVLRRSGPAAAEPTVYLLDSIGELASLYREGTMAFLGGSLVPAGGHNPIEAWAAGSPVAVGPHTANFAEVVERGEKLGILRRVADEAGLARAWQEALADPAAVQRAGALAERFVAESRGAADLTAAFVLPLLPQASAATSRAG